MLDQRKDFMCDALPLIGVTSDRSNEAPHHLHQVGEKYVKSIVDGANGLPVIIPALPNEIDVEKLLDRLDGVMITGSYSMLEPHHYDGSALPAGTLIDPARDAMSMALIKGAIARKMPILCICRGFQELNVVYGGTLYQAVHNEAGMLDHRDDKSLTFAEQYAPVHDLELTEGGLLASFELGNTVQVNSIHEQGIKDLGQGLLIEGRAPDGLIEAIRLDSDDQFCLALQFHPEYRVKENEFYTAIFSAFSQTVRSYQTSNK
ncbi:MAG: gamma-glutamyl-gamma-aminobutyrate hydrolase family protein [Pseudomonadales bacterium]|jgi:putative glutamine amidotransferase